MKRVIIGLLMVGIAGLGAEFPSRADTAKPRWPSLLLAQAQFHDERGEDGRMHPVPGAARLVMVYRSSDGGLWSARVLEDTVSNVFHKAMYFKPVVGGPGILTIGANKAALRLWRPRGGGWEATTLWQPEFGGKQNRLRDMEVGDVTGDGVDDVVIATHDQGVVEVIEQKGGEYVLKELSRHPCRYVHEIELADVDGDGKLEIFATPSAPNKLDGSIQPGKIMMFDTEDGKRFSSKLIEEFPTRHVKEILAYDFESSGRPSLFAALEGEQIGSNSAGTRSTEIKLYRFDRGGISDEMVAALPGKLCRFLTAGDVDGDGRTEIFASTHQSGIWMLKWSGGVWKKKLVDMDSSGFEHATYVADLDGDGKDEVYVAADDQGWLRRYAWSGGKTERTDLLELTGDIITFNITAITDRMLE